jgi:phage/plasmid primase-like uncharacterized protein
MSGLSKVINRVTGKTAAREAARAANATIADLNERKKTLQEENDKLTAQKDTERKKIQAKRVRSLRSSFRSPSFSAVSQDTKETLG